MPWFLFKAHVIFLIFQNICNKSLELKKKKKRKQELMSWQDHGKENYESS